LLSIQHKDTQTRCQTYWVTSEGVRLNYSNKRIVWPKFRWRYGQKPSIISPIQYGTLCPMIVDLLSFSALLRVFYKTESFDTAYRKREQSTYFLPPYAPLILLHSDSPAAYGAI